VKARILLVEDDNIIVMELCSRLYSSRCEIVAVASGGEEAIEQAIALQPDLVLMDIKLKGDMDGIDAAEQIRACLDVPIVYLTALADANTLQRAHKTQPAGYVAKPFEERELLHAIEMALENKDRDRTARACKSCPAGYRAQKQD
jgi:CheY-like chemotaxis protein